MSPTDIPFNESRPQAGPLPSKRGEIGYIEVAVESPIENLHPFNLTRHSIDRDQSSVHAEAVTPPPQSQAVTSGPSSEQLSSSTASITKFHGILDLFKPKGPPAFGGLRLYTLVIFALQLTLLGGTVTIWVLTIKHLPQTRFEQSTIIFHVIFVMLIIVQLVVLERGLFRLRGERYSYLHSGEILPRHRNMPLSNITLTFSPWNRPSIPTYAAALSEIGVGTGDVEDHLIAAPPPPPYGNTRGSTLLLSGFLRNSLTSRANSGHTGRDEQGDQVQNTGRAPRLEEIMSRLEPPSAVHIVDR